jgi:hypothetical protein
VHRDEGAAQVEVAVDRVVAIESMGVSGEEGTRRAA